MKANLILHRHNRHNGLCHNSPRLQSVIVRCCTYLADCGGWWTPIQPSRLGKMILDCLAVDPNDLYNDFTAPQRPGCKTYIRADIRYHLTLLQQLLLLILMILLLTL